MKRLVSTIVLVAITMSGCTQQPTNNSRQAIVVKTRYQAMQKPNLDITLEDVLKEKSNLIEVRGLEKNYKEGENLSFVVDTKGKIGYLYIMSVDNDSVTVLQPNPDSPLAEMRGERSFPEDFTSGAFYIKTVKNCKSCQKEKTTVYALLTKTPIDGIDKTITGENLLSFYKNSQQAKRAMRGIKRIHLDNNNSANLSIGKADFFVE